MIPLPSVISNQFKRSKYITQNWTNRLGDSDPSSHGWFDVNKEAAGDPNWVIDIQDTTDPYYSLPLEIIKGCSCQRKCTTCNCKKMDVRGNKCTALPCRRVKYPAMGQCQFWDTVVCSLLKHMREKLAHVI